MSTKWGNVPSYRQHKPTGRACIQFKQRAIYLGKWGSTSSLEAYTRFTALWGMLKSGVRQPPRLLTAADLRTDEAFERFLAEQCPGTGDKPTRVTPAVPVLADLRIFELTERYWTYAEGEYLRPDPYAAPSPVPDSPQTDGAAVTTSRNNLVPTGTAKNQKPALRQLNRLYGSTRATEFGPLAFKALRRSWVDAGLAVKTVNSYADVIKGVFRWAASEELLPAAIHTALKTVRSLRYGRGEAKETEPVMPVADAIVERTLPHLPTLVADMVRFQRLTGCRPSEVCNLRPCDVQRWTTIADEPLPLFGVVEAATRELDVWEYRPAHHKTKHKNRQRLVPIGPKAQEILRPYLLPLSFTPEAFCFSPATSEAERREKANAARKTPPRQGNHPGTNRKKKPQWTPGGRYDKDTYSQAVRRACEVAFGMPSHLREQVLRDAKKTATVDELAKLKRDAAAWRNKNCWSPNQLRHSAATAIRQRFGLEGAQVVLGHSEADTTQIYAQADWAKAVEIAREVG